MKSAQAGGGGAQLGLGKEMLGTTLGIGENRLQPWEIGSKVHPPQRSAPTTKSPHRGLGGTIRGGGFLGEVRFSRALRSEEIGDSPTSADFDRGATFE